MKQQLLEHLFCLIFHVALTQNDAPMMSHTYLQPAHSLAAAVKPEQGRHRFIKWDCTRLALNSFLDLDPGLREESLWITVYDDH